MESGIDSMTEGLDLSIVLSVVVIACGLIQIVVLRRHSRSLSVALSVMLGMLVLYGVLNVPAIEKPINHTVAGLTVLVKDLSIVGILCGANMMFWSLGYRHRGWRLVKWVVSGVLAVTKTILWLQLRQQCVADSGFMMDGCYFRSGWFVAGEVGMLVALSVWGFAIAGLLWKFAGLASAQQRVLALFVFAFTDAAVWAIIGAIGTVEVYLYGTYLAEQYILRPILSLAGALAFSVALVILPVRSMLGRVFLRWKIQPVLSVLNRKDVPTAPGVRSLTTEVMDRLGLLLQQESGHPLTHRDDSEAAQDLGVWLAGKSTTLPVSLPRNSRMDVQRRWLVEVAKVMRHESNRQ